MREIKFRIWDRGAKAWAKNDCSLHCFSNWQIDPFTGQLTDFVGAIDGDRETRYNANPALDYYWSDGQIVNEPQYVLMQYTGMKDKNGKDIYEGDIVKLFNGQIYKVEFIEESNEIQMSGYCFSSFGSEVIGNIFENGELLEQ